MNRKQHLPRGILELMLSSALGVARHCGRLAGAENLKNNPRWRGYLVSDRKHAADEFFRRADQLGIARLPFSLNT